MIFTDEITRILERNFTSPLNFLQLEENSSAILSAYLTKSAEVFEIFSSEKINKKHPLISLCFTDSLSLEAFARPLKNKNEYLVALSYGLFADIYACFTGLLSHPGILPHIGNPSDTHCKFDFCEYGLLDFTFEHDVIRENTPLEKGFPLYNYPKDEERILYATLLSDIAIQFVLYHEWGHISGSHIDYINDRYKLSEMAETEYVFHLDSNQKGMIGENPIRRSMEFEADFIAASMISSIPSNLFIHKRTIFQAYPAEFLAKYDTRSALFFSIMALFHLFEEVRIKKNREPSKNYPSPYLRFCSLIFGIYGHNQKEPDPFWKNFDFQGVKDFASGSLTLDFNFRFTDQVYDKKATRSEIIMLDDNLKELRTLLKDHRLHPS